MIEMKVERLIMTTEKLTVWIEHECDQEDQSVNGHYGTTQHHTIHILQRSQLLTSPKFIDGTGEQEAENA
jgi:hypothetical protein